MNTERHGFSPEAKSAEKTEAEHGESSEKGPEKISTMEAIATVLFGGLVIAIEAQRLFDNKGNEIKQVVEEAKGDLKEQPTEFGSILGGSLMRFESLLLDYEREQKEKTLEKRQKFLDSMHDVAAKKKQLEELDVLERLQREAIIKAAQFPQENAGVTEEEEKTKLRGSISAAGHARKEKARKQTEGFLGRLFKISE